MEKEKRPLISIVIPAYNLESYIEKTLDSVFAQTYHDLEVIAVDDGSTDETGYVLDRYAEKEIRLHVFHQQNAGVSRARLSGIRAAAGDYIGFVDGDDLIDPDMFQRLLENAKKHDADISHCGYRMVFPDGAVQDFYGSGKVLVQDRRAGLMDLLEGTLVEPGLCNKLFRRTLFDQLLDGQTIMDLSLRENEDLLMNYCLFRSAQRAVFEDFCPYQYQIRTSSASHGGMKPHILKDPIRIGELLLQDTKTDPDLYLLSARYYVTKLVKAAVVKCSSGDVELLAIQKEARRKLKGFLRTYFSLPEREKRKMLAFWAACSPASYRLAHHIYLNQR